MLQFEFNPISGDATETLPVFSGHGRLTLLLNGRDIWSDEESEERQGIEDYWDGLLHHLAKYWCYLMMEDPYPLDFNPISPDLFFNEAMRELRAKGLSEHSFLEEEARVFAFDRRHNLASGMPGIHLPPVFVLREGSDLRIVAESMDVLLPMKEAHCILENLGNTIAQSVHPQSPRGKIILEAWDKRDQLPTLEETYAMITGMSVDGIKALVANDDPEKMFGLPSLDKPSRMLLAARMTQHMLDVGEIRRVVERIDRISLGRLDQAFLALRCKADWELAGIRDQKHYRQGYHLAQWLRKRLGFCDEHRLDLESWLKSHGAVIGKSKGTLPSEIDALACWTDTEAAILINKSGTHAGKEWGEKASLAHELAHLLVDTGHALPSVDILGGKMPALVEKRANAFAAELLLPRSQVMAHLPEDLTFDTLKGLIDKLARKFQLGRVLIGNQISNLLRDRGSLTPMINRNIDRAIGEKNRDMKWSVWWSD